MTDRDSVADDRQRQCADDGQLQVADDRYSVADKMAVFHNQDDRDSIPVDNVVLMYVGFQLTCRQIQSTKFECYPRSWCIPPSYGYALRKADKTKAMCNMLWGCSETK